MRFIVVPYVLLYTSVLTEEVAHALEGTPLDPIEIASRQGPVVAAVTAFLWYLSRRDKDQRETYREMSKESHVTHREVGVMMKEAMERTATVLQEQASESRDIRRVLNKLVKEVHDD